MAAKKAENTENLSEEVKETKETKVNEIDIESLIREAVGKAVAETSNKYQSTIDELVEKNKELENKVTSSKSEGFNSNKRVKIMHMGVGSANFSRGRINVNFDEPFEVRTVRYDIFEEMYDLFGDWFRNFELVVLDKDVREYIGLDMSFKEYGADKDTFCEMLKLDSSECLKKVSKLKPMLALTFLKYFIEEYLEHNPDTVSKFADISEYYKSHYGINEMQSAIQESIDN